MKAFRVSRFETILLAVGCSMSAPAAHSQAANLADWPCEFCPFEEGQRAEIAVGASNVSDDSAYLGDASGYSEAGVYANVDGNGSVASDDYRMQWQVEDLGLDSRAAQLRGGIQGTYDFKVAYRQIPRYRFFTTDSIFLQSPANTLALPATWVRAPLTSGFTALAANLSPRNIESERRVAEIGGRYLPSSRLRFSAEYRRQEHDGVGVYGGSYFTQSSLLPGPFDYVTDSVDLGARYASDNGVLSLNYYLSDFDSGNPALRWENPFTSSPGGELAALAEAPDNRFQQLSLSGNYRFEKYRTVIAYTGAVGHLEQEAPFLPYTTNSSLMVAPLPRANLGGDIETGNLAVSITSRIHRKARVRLAYRYDERDNQTPQDLWTRVIADSFLSGETETNTPYSFRRAALTLGGDFDLLDTVRLSGGYARKSIDRDFQEVAEQTEDTGWGQVRWRPSAIFQLTGKAGASERDVDRYDESVAANLGQNPLLRKYHLAYRYRRFGELAIVTSLPERPISLTVTAMLADDEYTHSRLGLTGGRDLRLAADLNWAISERASVYLTGGYENIDSEQSGSESFAIADWQTNNSDTFYTAGGGLRVKQIADSFDFQLDYTRSQGTTEIDLSSASTGFSQFPDLESTLDNLRMRLSYNRSEQLQFNVDLRYQRFLVEDWALEGVGPGTIPVILTLGAEPYDDKAFIVALGIRYWIGKPKAAAVTSGE